MIKRDNFNQLVELAMQATGHTHMRPVITKELLHYDILYCLEDNGLLDKLTFQGGTSLRLCYGGYRFSEDLDFVGGHDFSTSQLINIKKCLEKYIGHRYGLHIEVKEPRELAEAPQNKDIKVDKWQVKITTEPEQRDLPKQKIKLEVTNVPAYSRTPQSLKKNYDFLPDGYSDIIIMTESLDEIMTDKLIALVSCQRYIRHRDIWDLRWLKQQGANVNADYILAKINDYKEKNYLQKLNLLLSRLDEIVHGGDFKTEMSRFIPMAIQSRTLQKEKFIEHLYHENKALLEQVKRIAENKPN
jgi:predicted nucleotidyltransferase component of viral defense system